MNLVYTVANLRTYPQGTGYSYFFSCWDKKLTQNATRRRKWFFWLPPPGHTSLFVTGGKPGKELKQELKTSL